MGRWYTRPAIRSSTTKGDSSEDGCSTDGEVSTSNAAEPLYCFCHGPESGTMIACDNSNCPFEWLYTKCLNLKSLPKHGTAQTVESCQNF